VFAVADDPEKWEVGRPRAAVAFGDQFVVDAEPKVEDVGVREAAPRLRLSCDRLLSGQAPAGTAEEGRWGRTRPAGFAALFPLT
jgi:hypothetical protein